MSTARYLLLLGLALLLIWRPETPATAAQTLVLKPSEGPPLRIDFDYQFKNAPPPFQKEPAWQGKEVARGFIPTIPPTPLLRNISANELYLNLDHSQDFVGGKLTTNRSRYEGHVVFRDLRVTTEREALEIPYTLDMYTYEHGCAGWYVVRSAWEGELELDQHKWRFGIVDNLDGRIGARDILYLELIQAGKGNGGMTISPVPPTLFLAGHTLDMGFTFKPAPKGVQLEAAITESQPPMGKLNLEAKGCRLLCLQNDRMTAVLDVSADTVSLPAGTYQITDASFERGSRPMGGPKFIKSEQQVSVQPGATASLRMGQPLRNTVQVTRDENQLKFCYQLHGAGDEQYEYYNWKNPPRFRVYKGPFRVASGTFPFG